MASASSMSVASVSGSSTTSGGASGAAGGGGAPTTESSVSSATTSGVTGAVGGASSGGARNTGTGGSSATSTGASGSSGKDVFGIQELYPSAPSGALWTSEHWASGTAYGLTERIDPHDPRQISGFRGTGSLEVTGNGELLMNGSQPRLYVYAGPSGPWRDVEVTVYYRRVQDDATAWAGLVVGARTGPEGHGTTPCDAHTYYSRLRHDGATDFDKELMHSSSTPKSRVEPDVVWPLEGELPFDRWIGWKYVIYNLPDGASVKLESYRDMTEGADGGSWELVNETTDAGGWYAQTSCDEQAPVNGESDLIYLEGGAAFVRNTGVEEARYRWVSVREIAP